MRWFNNLSVRWKILSVAVLGVFFFLLYFAFAFYASQTNLRQLHVIENQDFPLLTRINEVQVDFIKLRSTLVGAINLQDVTSLNDARKQGEQLLKRLKAIHVDNADQSAALAQLTSTFEDYMQAAGQLAGEMLSKSQGSNFYTIIHKVQQLQETFEDQALAFQKTGTRLFSNKLAASRLNNQQMQELGLFLGLVSILLLLLLVWRITRSINRPLGYAVEVANDIAEGNWEQDIKASTTDETGMLLAAIRRMRDILKHAREQDRRQERMAQLLAELNDRLRGDLDLQQLGHNLLGYLVPSLDAQVGAFYVYDEDERKLRLSSSYGLTQRKNLANGYELGDSLVGQSALEKQQILLTQVPNGYLSIQSATGEATPATVIVTPILHEDELKGVLELAAFHAFDEQDREVLEKGVNAIAVAIQSAQSRVKLNVMLKQTREQAEALEKQKEEMKQVNDDLEKQAMELAASESRLQQQQEELKAINEELEAQTQALKASEESLQAQQEELRVTNEELEAQAKMLADQKSEMSHKNVELEKLHKELSDKLRELELSSKYKSEFLSTMSHELRTPLNSILILSNALAANKKGNLDEKQIEHAQVIHSAGSDLLALINDILDISKIEEGKMDIIIDDIDTRDLGEHFRRNFSHVAENKGVVFKVEMADDLPPHFYTDRHRVEQIIKNLLSNALKFTQEGSVTLSLSRPAADEMLPARTLKTKDTIKLAVTDTGIGIPEDKQRLVFEAFQQADGTTSRKFGGTGLGLTISRELARLLKGEIGLYSAGMDQGSTFTLYLPIGNSKDVEREEDDTNDGVVPPSVGEQVQENGQPLVADVHVQEKNVLVIEDDAVFAQVLVDLAAEYGLEGHVCEDGESGLEYAHQYRPSAIILDIGLPGISGWDVMEKLKADPRTKDIPVHFLSGAKGERKKALSLGAMDFLTKPVNEKQLGKAFTKIEKAIAKNVRHLLVVEDSELQHEGIRTLFAEKGVEIHSVTTGAEALKALKEQVFDCMILDLSLPDMSGTELLETLHASDDYDPVPVIVYTGKELSRDEEAHLRKYADRIILKTDRSSERLLNEASLFLHWLESTLPSNKRHNPELVEHRDDVFEGKKLLLVDDDMRNIYALSAQLEELGFDITLANNGREAIETLNEKPDMEIVLMDIMMPEMDGYEAMQHIRKQARFAKLPILALTAKAMKEDRSKCIEAGANDYCSKPIDMARLTSLLRVWLHKS
jgi:CheY-like chemotaxis protein/signal transduction histidine kinase